MDACVSVYREQLNEDGQVDFKSKGKAFLRAYGFLAAILAYTDAGWEKLSIFLTFLVAKLPAPVEDDLSKGILEAIDMDSYRVEKQAVQAIQLPDEDAEIGPVPTDGGGHKPEPVMYSSLGYQIGPQSSSIVLPLAQSVFDTVPNPPLTFQIASCSLSITVIRRVIRCAAAH